jgi:hypothetical protein
MAMKRMAKGRVARWEFVRLILVSGNPGYGGLPDLSFFDLKLSWRNKDIRGPGRWQKPIGEWDHKILCRLTILKDDFKHTAVDI